MPARQHAFTELELAVGAAPRCRRLTAGATDPTEPFDADTLADLNGDWFEKEVVRMIRLPSLLPPPNLAPS